MPPLATGLGEAKERGRVEGRKEGREGESGAQPDFDDRGDM